MVVVVEMAVTDDLTRRRKKKISPTTHTAVDISGVAFSSRVCVCVYVRGVANLLPPPPFTAADYLPPSAVAAGASSSFLTGILVAVLIVKPKKHEFDL